MEAGDHRRMITVKQYAYAWFGNRIGPWRSKRQEAEIDALREGRAQRDRDSKRIYMVVPASIVTRRIEPPMPDLLLEAMEHGL